MPTTPDPVAAKTPRAVGRYLGMYVLLYEEHDGWIEARSPDREAPGRSHGKSEPLTFTGSGPDAWAGRLWADQVKVLLELPA